MYDFFFWMRRLGIVTMMVRFNLATICTTQSLISFDSIFVLITVDGWSELVNHYIAHPER